MDKLNRFRVLFARYQAAMLVNVHEVICGKLHHEPHCCHLLRFDIFGVVVILLRPEEVLPERLQMLLLLLIKPCCVHLLEGFLRYVTDVLQHKQSFRVNSIFLSWHPDHSLDSR